VRTYRLLQLGVSVTEQRDMSKRDLDWLLEIDAVYAEVAEEERASRG
jgi:hypothetical protein